MDDLAAHLEVERDVAAAVVGHLLSDDVDPVRDRVPVRWALAPGSDLPHARREEVRRPVGVALVVRPLDRSTGDRARSPAARTAGGIRGVDRAPDANGVRKRMDRGPVTVS